MEAVTLMKNVRTAANGFGWTVKSKGEAMRIFAESEAAGKLIIHVATVSSLKLVAKVIMDIDLSDYSEKEADAICVFALQRNMSRDHRGTWSYDTDSMRIIYQHHISAPGEDTDLTDAVAEIERFMQTIAGAHDIADDAAEKAFIQALA